MMNGDNINIGSDIESDKRKGIMTAGCTYSAGFFNNNSFLKSRQRNKSMDINYA